MALILILFVAIQVEVLDAHESVVMNPFLQPMPLLFEDRANREVILLHKTSWPDCRTKSCKIWSNSASMVRRVRVEGLANDEHPKAFVRPLLE